MFSCEFCEISNNIFFTEHLQAGRCLYPFDKMKFYMFLMTYMDRNKKQCIFQMSRCNIYVGLQKVNSIINRFHFKIQNRKYKIV